MIVRRVVGWFDDRLGVGGFLRESLNKVFPDHWSFMIGEIALYCFVILVATGAYLTFFFVPDSREVIYDGSYSPLVGLKMSEAYRSTVELSFDVRAGLVMRQIHHWAALIFIAAIVVHLARVFFTGAFRRPRELNWIIGLTLLLLAIFNGFTGYSLPDDLLSGTGLRIAHSVALSVPVIGTWAAFLIFGGEFPGDQIIGRLYPMHIMLVPALMGALLAAHMAVLWRQKHTQFPGPGRTEHNVVGSRLWPVYAFKSIGLFAMVAAVLAALGGLAQINPVWLYGPFDASSVSSPSQPDWYLGWLEGALRLFPSWEPHIFGYTVPNPFFPAVVLPGLTFAALYAWPFLEARITGDRAHHELLDRPRDRPVRTALGMIALSFYMVLFFAGSNDILARFTGVPVSIVTNAFVVALLGLPPLVGVLTFISCRALRASGASGLLGVTWSDVRTGLSRTRS